MIYVGVLDLLTEKDYKTMETESPNKLVLFAKKDATVPVTQAIRFSALANNIKEFKLIEAESPDLRAYYIGQVCGKETEEVKLITDLGFSEDLLATLCPQQKKNGCTRFMEKR